MGGMTLKLRASTPDVTAASKAVTVGANVDYVHEKVAIATAFDILNASGPTLKASFVAPVRAAWLFGAETHYGLGNNPQLKQFNLKGSYTALNAPGITYSFWRNAGAATLYGASVFHAFEQGRYTAAEVTYDANKADKGPSCAFAFGKVDMNGKAKVKVSTAGRAAVS